MSASSPRGELTKLLIEAQAGDAQAHQAVYQRLYGDLKRFARAQLARRPAATLTPTALVNETYLRLIDFDKLDVSSRQHFLGICVSAMRHILIDHHRAAMAQKRGGERRKTQMDVEALGEDASAGDVLEIDAALDKLRGLSERLARIVEYKFYLGLTEEEIGAAIGLTSRTVRSDWRKARAWLARELQ